MNPKGIAGFCDYLVTEMGTSGQFRVGDFGISRLDLLAPWFPNRRRFAFERDGFTAIVMANRPQFSHYRPSSDGPIFQYKHDLTLSIFIQSIDQYPLEGEIYQLPAIIEHLSKIWPARAEYDIQTITLKSSNFLPLEWEEKSVLVLETNLEMQGELCVGLASWGKISTIDFSSVAAGNAQGGYSFMPVVRVEVIGQGSGPTGNGKPGITIEVNSSR